MFPPINAHSRPPSEDLRGLNHHSSESPTGSKQQQQQQQQQPSGATVGAAQVRRQQTLEQNRRSPLRSKEEKRMKTKRFSLFSRFEFF